MTTYRNPLDVITEGRALPKGYDRWALKSTQPDLTTRYGYRWPFPGKIATASGPFSESTDSCPEWRGDGICVATTYAGMATGGYPAITLLLVAFRTSDVLAERGGKVRVKRCKVVELLDGAKIARADLAGADLRDANLRGADLSRADLRDADLDMSAWPLWCGGTQTYLDRRRSLQLVYHLFNQNHQDPKILAVLEALRPLANEFREKYRGDAPALRGPEMVLAPNKENK